MHFRLHSLNPSSSPELVAATNWPGDFVLVRPLGSQEPTHHRANDRISMRGEKVVGRGKGYLGLAAEAVRYDSSRSAKGNPISKKKVPSSPVAGLELANLREREGGRGRDGGRRLAIGKAMGASIGESREREGERGGRKRKGEREEKGDEAGRPPLPYRRLTVREGWSLGRESERERERGRERKRERQGGRERREDEGAAIVAAATPPRRRRANVRPPARPWGLNRRAERGREKERGRGGEEAKKRKKNGAVSWERGPTQRVFL